MSISAALVSSFLLFSQLHIIHSRIGQTSRFTSLSFGSTHDFTILCNSHDDFSSPQKIGPRIEGSMTTIGTDVVVFSMSCTVSSFKNFSLWLGLSYNMDIAYVPYPFTYGIFTFFHLNWWDWIVIHTTTSSDSLFLIATKNIYCTYPFSGNFSKEFTIVGLLYPV